MDINESLTLVGRVLQLEKIHGLSRRGPVWVTQGLVSPALCAAGLGIPACGMD